MAEKADAPRTGTWDHKGMSPNEKNRGCLSLGSLIWYPGVDSPVLADWAREPPASGS